MISPIDKCKFKSLCWGNCNSPDFKAFYSIILLHQLSHRTQSLNLNAAFTNTYKQGSNSKKEREMERQRERESMIEYDECQREMKRERMRKRGREGYRGVI